MTRQKGVLKHRPVKASPADISLKASVVFCWSSHVDFKTQSLSTLANDMSTARPTQFYWQWSVWGRRVVEGGCVLVWVQIQTNQFGA